MAVCSMTLRALPSAASAPAETPEIETDSKTFAEPPSLEGAADNRTTGTGVPLGVALREALFEAVPLAEAELEALLVAVVVCVEMDGTSGGAGSKEGKTDMRSSSSVADLPWME
jgi:hypothetical protein